MAAAPTDHLKCSQNLNPQSAKTRKRESVGKVGSCDGKRNYRWNWRIRIRLGGGKAGDNSQEVVIECLPRVRDAPRRFEGGAHGIEIGIGRVLGRMKGCSRGCWGYDVRRVVRQVDVKYLPQMDSTCRELN